MKHSIKASGALAAVSLAIAGCVSAPEPSSRLLAAEASVQKARTDPATLAAGRAPLERADIALREARNSFMKRQDDEYLHFLRMGEGYVALAEARGDQADANGKIASLNKDRSDAVAAARSRDLKAAESAATASASAAAVSAAEAKQADARARQSDARAQESDRIAADALADTNAAKAAQLAAEARTSAINLELASYEKKQTALGLMLILRDLQFATASATLTRGAEGRLAPLAAFLAGQPDARIDVSGHTDSQGTDAANLVLSERRAESVGNYLISTGVARSRIVTHGLGESHPTATNDTAAGRAINRRVEVTILN